MKNTLLAFLLCLAVFQEPAKGRELPAFSSLDLAKTNGALVENLHLHWALMVSRLSDAQKLGVSADDAFAFPKERLMITAFTNYFFVTGVIHGEAYATRCSSLVTYESPSNSIPDRWQGELPSEEISRLKHLAKQKVKFNEEKALSAARSFLASSGFSEETLGLGSPTINQIKMSVPVSESQPAKFQSLLLPVYSIRWKDKMDGQVLMQVSGVTGKVVLYINEAKNLPLCGDENYQNLLSKTVNRRESSGAK